MSLYNISNKNLTAQTPTTFAAEGLQERHDLQEALKGCIDAIAPDCLVISEEFTDWEEARRAAHKRSKRRKRLLRVPL